MHLREYNAEQFFEQFFRASIDTMDDLDDCRTYVAEYFSLKIPHHGEAVFTELDKAESFLFEMYAEATPNLAPAERRLRWLRATVR